MKTLHKLSLTAAVAVLLVLYCSGGVQLSNADSRRRRRRQPRESEVIHAPHAANPEPVYRDPQRAHRLPSALDVYGYDGAAAAEAELATPGGAGIAQIEEGPPSDVAVEPRANDVAIVAAANAAGPGPANLRPGAIAPGEPGAAAALEEEDQEVDRGATGAASALEAAAALEEEAAQEAIHADRSRINAWDGKEMVLDGDSERHNPNLVPGKRPRRHHGPNRRRGPPDEGVAAHEEHHDSSMQDAVGLAVDADADADGGAPAEFVPTFDWQVILEGQSVPAGLEISIDLQTGLKKARQMKERPGIMLPSEIKREKKRRQLQRLRERSEHGDHPLVHCDTTKGKLSLEVRFDWAPIGATRLAELVQAEYFTNNVIYRVPPLRSLPLAQFGMVPNKQLQKQFDGHKIKDDTLHPTIKKGDIAFAGSGPDSRTCHLWVARDDSDWLGKAAWETPVARIAAGMAAIDALNEVGDLEPWGKGPAPSKIHADKSFYSHFPGSYLASEFPDVDFWKSCRFADEDVRAPPPGDLNEEFEL